MKDSPEHAKVIGGEEPPDVDTLEDLGDLLEGDRTRDDFLSVALQLREPKPIAEIANLAGRGEDAAREYMRWFETIGMVRRAAEGPEQYETNQSYLYWRRVDRIRNTFEDSEIVERLQEVLDELDEFQERYEASHPTEVDLVSTAEARETDVEAVWEDVSRWKTLLARRNLLEDALDQTQDRYLDASGNSEGSSKRGPPA